MITLKPGTPYAPTSIGTDYAAFCDIQGELPVTGDEPANIEMTGGGTEKLAAFRFGVSGTVFFADRNNVQGLVIDVGPEVPPEPPEPGPEPQPPVVTVLFTTERYVNGYTSGGSLGRVPDLTPPADYSVSVLSLTFDPSQYGPLPVGSKFVVRIDDTMGTDVALNDPFEPVGDAPFDVPLTDQAKATVFNRVINSGEMFNVWLISDVEPTNAADNPAMKFEIEFKNAAVASRKSVPK